MPFLIKALSLCINEFPNCNASYDAAAGSLLIHQQHNIGIAMTTEYGLIVPVIKGVQMMNMDQLIHAYHELITKAHQNKLSSKDMKEGTITISNYGIGGHGEWASPIINYPEAAILAVGKIHSQAQVKNGTVSSCEVINLSWSFDHRIIDGDLALRISDKFCRLIQNPASLL
jgi:pyruvate dehydrogenase E2 component (dihydrolipoamide acetyltransferase)/2-oxoisovalerate dehydrogenase E2 component (dihydrolipoyl transacylase)